MLFRVAAKIMSTPAACAKRVREACLLRAQSATKQQRCAEPQRAGRAQTALPDFHNLAEEAPLYAIALVCKRPHVAQHARSLDLPANCHAHRACSASSYLHLMFSVERVLLVTRQACASGAALCTALSRTLATGAESSIEAIQPRG